MPLRVVRHLGWLLRHHSHNGSAAPGPKLKPRPAAIQISTSPPPAAKVSPPAETPRP